MSMERQTMAQAVGEAPPSNLIFIPGEDFDPTDPDDVADVQLAMQYDMHDRLRHAEQENARLRALLDD